MSDSAWRGPSAGASVTGREPKAMAASGGWPPERFAPLLRDLVQWGLVLEDETGRWVLRDDVQRHLSSHRHLETEAQVYVGYRCQHCGAAGVTWAMEDRHLCASCIEAQRSGVDDGLEATPAKLSGRRLLLTRRSAPDTRNGRTG
jgi:hypothetical protein